MRIMSNGYVYGECIWNLLSLRRFRDLKAGSADDKINHHLGAPTRLIYTYSDGYLGHESHLGRVLGLSSCWGASLR